MHINDWASNAGAQYGALAHSLLNGRLDLEKDPPAAMAELENPYDTAARQAAAPDACGMWPTITDAITSISASCPAFCSSFRLRH